MTDTVKTKKPGKLSKVSRFFKQLKLEMKKVVWPTKEQLISSTISVLVFCAIIGVLITILDSLVGGLIIKQILKIG